jgi:hypothetical protein
MLSIPEALKIERADQTAQPTLREGMDGEIKLMGGA